MNRICALWCAGLTLLAGGCTSDPSHAGADAAEDAAQDAAADVSPPLEPCEEGATLFTRDNSEQDHVLGPGGEVGVVLGFQGFIFSRVGVYSPYPLGDRTQIHSRAVVDGDLTIDVTTTHSAIKSWPRDDGTWETEAMWLFFNNNPLTDLIGHPATLSFRVPTEVCELTVTLDVNLISAGEMGEDGFADCEPQCVPE